MAPKLLLAFKIKAKLFTDCFYGQCVHANPLNVKGFVSM